MYRKYQRYRKSFFYSTFGVHYFIIIGHIPSPLSAPQHITALMNGFCAGLVLTVGGGGRVSGIFLISFICEFPFVSFVLFPTVKGGLYLSIIVAFAFILTVSASLFSTWDMLFVFCSFLVLFTKWGVF